jgi:RNA polymerase sigma factor (TIGR02999 family)
MSAEDVHMSKSRDSASENFPDGRVSLDIPSPAERCDPSAADQLVPRIYDELRRLAACKLAQEKTGQTLQPTALVHEAYLRLLGGGDGAAGGEQRWDSPGHFYACVAEAMHRILIERAREKHAQKRGGGRKRIDIDAVDLAIEATPDQLLALDDVLSKLAHEDEAAARLVELRYFGGLTVDEAGKVLGMSTATAYRHWKYARAWLYSELLETSRS